MLNSAPQTSRGKSLRILVVTPFGLGGRGGIDRIMDEVQAQLAAKPLGDIQVSFVASRGQGPLLLSIPLVLGVSLRLFGAPFGLGPDVVHINVAQDGSTLRKIFIARTARFLGIPYLVHLHGSRFRQSWDEASPFVSERMRNLFLRAARTLVLGRVWREFVLSKVPEIEDRIEILPNATASAPIVERPSQRDHVVVLFLGLVSERKGAPILLEALAQLRNEPAWRAIIAGNGEVEAAQAKTRELGLEERIELPGWVGPEEARRLLAEADILVLPSRDENLPMSVIEGMANGLAVVTTPVGAIEDIIIPEETGLLVPPGDARALAGALQRLILAPDLRAKLGSSARAFHAQHLEISAYYRRLLEIWREVGGRAEG